MIRLILLLILCLFLSVEAYSEDLHSEVYTTAIAVRQNRISICLHIVGVGRDAG